MLPFSSLLWIRLVFELGAGSAAAELTVLVQKRDQAQVSCEAWLVKDDERFDIPTDQPIDKRIGPKWAAEVLRSVRNAPPTTSCNNLYAFVAARGSELSADDLRRLDMSPCCALEARVKGLTSIADMRSYFKLSRSIRAEAATELLSLLRDQTQAATSIAFLRLAGKALATYANEKMLVVSPRRKAAIAAFNQQVEAAVKESRAARDVAALSDARKRCDELRLELVALVRALARH